MLQTFRINYGAVSENRSKFGMLSLSPAHTHAGTTGTSSLIIIRDICSVVLLFMRYLLCGFIIYFLTPSLQLLLNRAIRIKKVYGRRTVHQTENFCGME
jgi:multisubunit Na+/H+ antiporter MnhG subunit